MYYPTDEIPPEKQAERSLEDFKRTYAPLSGESIDQAAQDVCFRFLTDHPEKYNESLIKDINFDKRRLHRVYAKKLLREFESIHTAWQEPYLNILANFIRAEFAASGVDLTSEKKLPEPYERRLETSIARIKAIVPDNCY